MFICDTCSKILITAHKFKEKCTQTYYRDHKTYEPVTKIKTEVFDAYQAVHQYELIPDESEMMQESQLEEIEMDEYIIGRRKNKNKNVLDPLQNPLKFGTKRKNNTKYTIEEKLKAVELGEQVGNRQAAKMLSINESCVRLWRQQKDKLIKKDLQIHQSSIKKWRNQKEQITGMMEESESKDTLGLELSKVES